MSPSAAEERIRRTLEIVEPSVRPSAVLDEAMRNDGRLDVPTDERQLHRFVVGPLREAMRRAAGDEAAVRLVSALAKLHGWRATTVGMPVVGSEPSRSSTPPAPTSAPRVGPRKRRRGPMTVAYLEVDEHDRPVDVVLVDPVAERVDAIAVELDRAGVFVAPIIELEVAVELCAKIGPSLVLYSAELDSASVAALAAAVVQSEAPAGQLRPYARAGEALPLLDGVSPPLRYATIEQLVGRVVQLLGRADRRD